MIITVLVWFCDLRLVQHRAKPAVLLERHGARCARDQAGLKIGVVGQLRPPVADRAECCRMTARPSSAARDDAASSVDCRSGIFGPYWLSGEK